MMFNLFEKWLSISKYLLIFTIFISFASHASGSTYSVNNVFGQTLSSSNGDITFVADYGGDGDQEYIYVEHTPPRSFLVDPVKIGPYGAPDHENITFSTGPNASVSFSGLARGTHQFIFVHCFASERDVYETWIMQCQNLGVQTTVNVSVNNDSTMARSYFSDTNGSAQLYLGYDNQFDRPVVVLQGYKPKDKVGSFDEWYNQLNSQAMLNTLRSQGYDIILYRYNDVNAGVTAAAAGLEFMLKRFNDNDFSRVRSVSLLGQSMGGVVARYALLHLDSLGIKTKVTTWVSYDSPHLGAIIPQSIVDNLNKIYDYIDVTGCGLKASCRRARADIKNYINDLNSGTASELLLNGPKNANNRNALNAQISAMGSFPKIPSLGIANGTLYVPQANPQSSVLLTSFDIYRPWPYDNPTIKFWTNPTVENQPGGYENFYSTLNEKVIDMSAQLRKVVLGNQIHAFVTTSSAIGNLPFTKVITADSNSTNEAHLQVTKPKSDAIVSWLNSYQL